MGSAPLPFEPEASSSPSLGGRASKGLDTPFEGTLGGGIGAVSALAAAEPGRAAGATPESDDVQEAAATDASALSTSEATSAATPIPGVRRLDGLLDELEAPGVRRGLPTPESPTAWQLAAVRGRLTELSSGRDAAALTAVARLIFEAQRSEEPVAWVARADSSFYPPDLAECGIDLAALAVVRAQRTLDGAKAVDHLLRSGAFGLIVLDLGPGAWLALPVQSRLVGLSKHHDTAVVCLTEKAERDASIGSLVSLRAHARRGERLGDRYRCRVEALKDKRRGPGWSFGEICRGPEGLT